ncbi:MAG: hypothetical protein JJV92_10035 [Desulfosarcina sp.]|nr:hypothetical protein [Desulfobacterales bacterium]
MAEFESGFQIGKEIQELRDRLEAIENSVQISVEPGTLIAEPPEKIEELPTVMDEESLTIEKAAPASYGYIGSKYAGIRFKEWNGKNYVTESDSLTVFSGTKRVSIRIGSLRFQYGHNFYKERPLGTIAYYPSITGFSGTLAAFRITALLRDKNGDDKWNAYFQVVIDCFG